MTTTPSTHTTPELPKISDATWRERVAAEFERLGGPGMPLAYDQTGLPRAEAVNKARDYADHSMLDEIHGMLRHLLTRAAS